MKVIYRISLIGLILSTSMFGQALFQGLYQPIDARGWGMGAALVAQTRNSSGVTYNPAILTVVPRTCQLNYTRYVLDIQATNALITWRAPGRGNLAAIVGYFDYGNFKETDEDGHELGEFHVSDLTLRIGYGLPLTGKLSAGLTATVINSDLANYNSKALLGSMGLLYYDAISTLSIGLAYTNFGRLLSGYISDEEKIQPALMAGVSKKLEHLPMIIAADLMHYEAGDYIVKIGGEFLIGSNFFLRWGTSSRRFGINTRHTLTNFFNSSSLGGGVVINRLQVDLTWLSLGHAGSVFAFSIAQNF
ncbi:MAG: PorV/PorQ family protein [Candidatus Neomarinimicrobiota bacterium]